jgi:hypothetical protein
MRGLICLKGVKFLPRMPRKSAPMPGTNFADLSVGNFRELAYCDNPEANGMKEHQKTAETVAYLRSFAECHPALPISDLAEACETRLSDLAIVCANCHPMLHRARPWKTGQELKKLVRRDNPLRLRLHVWEGVTIKKT